LSLFHFKNGILTTFAGETMQVLDAEQRKVTHAKPLHGLLKGSEYLLEGLRLIRQPRLRVFVVMPLIINIVVFGLIFYWVEGIYADWVARLMSWLPHWLNFLSSLFWLVYGWFIVMLLVWGFSTVANFIGAPFYSYLSEQVERQLTGQKRAGDASSFKTLLLLIPKSLARELKKLMYYLPRALILLVLGFIPGLNLVATVAWFLFSAWMMTIQYMDYPADNRGESLDKLKATARAHRLTSLVFGSWVGVGMLIPVVNLIILPAAVCGATKLWLDAHSESEVLSQ
jgi:CysZ protein